MGRLVDAVIDARSRVEGVGEILAQHELVGDRAPAPNGPKAVNVGAGDRLHIEQGYNKA